MMFLDLRKVHRNLDIPEKTLSNMNCFVLIATTPLLSCNLVLTRRPVIKILDDDCSAVCPLCS